MSDAAQIAEKQGIEAAVLQGDRDPATLTNYLSVLERISSTHTGILSFHWPSTSYPIYFRCGSSDLWNFKQIFLGHEYGFAMPYTPRRIVDLGAYVGYAAIYFLERFPSASLIAVEPSPDNFRLLTLNTAAYSNIRRLNVAVWGSTSRMAMEPYRAGDWGGRLVVASEPSDQIQALSLADVLDTAGWADADFIKCDVEGAEVNIFSEARELIAGMAMCCAVETHDAIAPESSKTVAACFDAASFTHSRSGEFDVFLRRDMQSFDADPAPLSLLRPNLGVIPLSLRNVPAAVWGFYIFGGASCQVHPSGPGEAVPEVSLVISFSGQTTFHCELETAGVIRFGVRFIFEIRSIEGDRVAYSSSTEVPPGVRRPWAVAFLALQGRWRVALRNTMVPEATTNHQALANWIEPGFR
jgi:FkbM family methyltransferase